MKAVFFAVMKQPLLGKPVTLLRSWQREQLHQFSWYVLFILTFVLSLFDMILV